MARAESAGEKKNSLWDVVFFIGAAALVLAGLGEVGNN